MKRCSASELAHPLKAEAGEAGRRSPGVILPDGWLDIDVELDLVAVRILDVEAVGDGVIRGTDEAGTGGHQLVSGFDSMTLRIVGWLTRSSSRCAGRCAATSWTAVDT